MKRTVFTVLIVFILIAFGLVLGSCWAYKHFITDQIKDKGGMENPQYIRTVNRPSEGAKLVYCTLQSQGEMAEYNYSFTLEQVGTEVLLYASYYAEDGYHKEIDGKKVDQEALSALNTLALSLDLIETIDIATETKPLLLDASSQTYTLRWDDGTTVTPDAGFQKIKEYFDTEILSRIGNTSDSEE